MTHSSRTGRPGFRYRVALCLGLAAATFCGPLTGLARADDDDWHHERHERHWRHHEWREGYYRQPDVYYSAPPVVYPPYGYYQQPGATFSFSVPFR